MVASGQVCIRMIASTSSIPSPARECDNTVVSQLVPRHTYRHERKWHRHYAPIFFRTSEEGLSFAALSAQRRDARTPLNLGTPSPLVFPREFPFQIIPTIRWIDIYSYFCNPVAYSFFGGGGKKAMKKGCESEPLGNRDAKDITNQNRAIFQQFLQNFSCFDF